MELIQQLVSQLGVSNEQAEGGAGALFKLAQENLGADDFSQVSNLIPGLEDLIGKAPEGAAAGGEGGGLMGMLGGVAEAVGMGDAAEKLGSLAGLAATFEKLGLDTDMISKFVSTVMDFLKSKGGESVAAILQGVLK